MNQENSKHSAEIQLQILLFYLQIFSTTKTISSFSVHREENIKNLAKMSSLICELVNFVYIEFSKNPF